MYFKTSITICEKKLINQIVNSDSLKKHSNPSLSGLNLIFSKQGYFILHYFFVNKK